MHASIDAMLFNGTFHTERISATHLRSANQKMEFRNDVIRVIIIIIIIIIAMTMFMVLSS